MGCPDAIVHYLAGLQGVNEIAFDVEKRVFKMSAEDCFERVNLEQAINEVSKQEGRNFSIIVYEEN